MTKSVLVDRLRPRSIARCAECILGAVFLLAGVAKLIDPELVASAIATVTGSATLEVTAAWVLSPLEILLGTALVAGKARPASHLVVFASLVAFTVFLYRLQMLDNEASCGCFGAVIDRFVGGSAQLGYIRNGGLFLLALVAAGTNMPARRNRPIRAGVPLPGVILVLATLPAASAAAQWGSQWMHPGHDAMTPREEERLVETLNLSDDQRTVAGILIETYRKAHEERYEAFRRAQGERTRLQNDDSLSRDVWKKRGAELYQQIIDLGLEELAAREKLRDDLAALINENQREAWRRYWADHRRRIAMPLGFNFVESQVDLITLCEELELLDEPNPDLVRALTDALDRYAWALDELVQEWMSVRFEALRAFHEETLMRYNDTYYLNHPEELPPLGATSEELDAWNEWIQERTSEKRIEKDEPEKRVCRNIRDLNRGTLEELRRLLPPEEAEALQRAYEQRAYPKYCNPPGRTKFHGHYYVETALGLNDLTEAQRRGIEDVRAAYLRRFEANKERLIDIHSRIESDWKDNEYRNGDLSPKLKQEQEAALQDRREIQESAIAKVDGWLSAEQTAALEKARQRAAERTPIQW